MTGVVCTGIFIVIVVFLGGCSNLSIPTFTTDTIEELLNFEKEKGVVLNHTSTLHPTTELIKEMPAPRPVEKRSLKFSVAGDFTIGSDESFGYTNTFDHEADKMDMSFSSKT